MSDNVQIYDATSATLYMKTTDNAGVHTPHHIIDSMPTVTVTGGLTDTELRATPVSTSIVNGADTAEISTGAVDGEKGLRVFIGPTDPVSDLPVFVEFEHHQVHEGETYRAQSAALSATQQFVIVTGAHANPIQAPHMIVGAAVYGGAMRLELYEGLSVAGTVGAALTPHNRRRQSTNTPTATISLVTGATGTTLLETTMIAASERTSDNRAGSEWILKPSTSYLVVATEVVAYTDTFVTFSWYEDLGV